MEGIGEMVGIGEMEGRGEMVGRDLIGRDRRKVHQT
jgi:hypothetical protein